MEGRPPPAVSAEVVAAERQAWAEPKWQHVLVERRVEIQGATPKGQADGEAVREERTKARRERKEPEKKRAKTREL
jgi:hypothetical protein